MNEIVYELKEIYKSSAFASENLSFNEALSYLAEWQGANFDPILLPQLSDKQRKAVSDAFRRIADGYPLQYITGKARFYTSDFAVREGVLIPRRDSETVVEKAIELIPEGAHFLDLCTGSGCLGLSVLKERPDTTATLVDISDTALDVARENAELLGLSRRCSFLKFDLLSETIDALPRHDAVIMNPPYLTTAEMSAIPENVCHEPSLALDGGEDGLIFYRLFAGHTRPLIFEIGAGQADDLLKLFPDGAVEKDLGSNPRVFYRTI